MHRRRWAKLVCLEMPLRTIILRGFAVNRLENDYELDLMMFTYNDR